MSHRQLCLSLLLLFLVFVLPPPLSAQPALAGPEITIATSGDSLGVTLLSHSDGSFTAVWLGGSRLGSRRFDARSLPLTGAIPLGTSDGFDAAALDEGFVVTGFAERNLYPRLLGRIFDLDGTPRGAPFLIDLAASPALSVPQVAASPGGGFSVVWIGQDPQRRRRITFLRRFSSTGVPQGKALRMTDPGFSEDLYAANVFRAPDGRLLVIGFSYGYAAGQFLGPAGERLGKPFSLGAPASPPAVAFTPDGGFLAVWRGDLPELPENPGVRVSGNFGRFYERTGSPRSGPFSLETDRNGLVSLSSPRVAADPQGRLFAAWSNHPFGLRVVEIGPDGSLGPILARPNHLNTGGPLAIAAWGDGDLAVAWGQYETEAWNSIGLGLQRFATHASPGTLQVQGGLQAGLEGSGPFTIRVERREGDRGAVSARYSVRSNVARPGEDFLPVSGIVAFADGETNPKSIEIPVLDDALPEGEEPLVLALSEPAGGAGLGSPARTRIDIRDDDAPCPLLVSAEATFDVDPGSYAPFSLVEKPVVAALAGGGFVAAWKTWDDRWQIFPGHGSALYDASGQRIANSLWPFEGGGHGLAARPDGSFTLTGEAFDLSTSFGKPLGVFGQDFNSAGQALTPPYSFPGNPEAIAPAKAGGLFSLGWFRSAAGTVTIYLVRLRKLGQPAGPSQVVTLDGGWSALASDGRGRGLVAWTEGPNGASRLFVRRMSAGGQWLGGPVAVDPLPERRPGPMAIAAAPDGRFVVVWEGFHDGHGLGIFGRRFAASGEPLGPVFLVNSRTAGDQTAPRVAVQGDGRFLVVWQSPRNNGRVKLYGQYFSGDGSRLGGEMPMSGEAPPENPYEEEREAVLSSNAAGRYVLVWTRAGEPVAISARRLTAPDED